MTKALVFIFIFAFWLSLTWNNFYHWDEWKYMSTFNQPLTTLLTRSSVEHYDPLNILHHLIFFKIFGLSHLPLQLSVILAHTINCLLLYFLLKKEGISQNISLIMTLLFGISSAYVENLFWTQPFNVLAGTLVFLAYYLAPNRVLLSALLLLLAPFYNGLALLFPFAFFFAFSKNRRYYLIVGLINLVILFHFSAGKIVSDVSPNPLAIILGIPNFLFTGLWRGIVLRFFSPDLGLPNLPTSFSSLRPLISLISLTTLIAFILKVRHKIPSILPFLPLLVVPYLAAAPARISFGPLAAANSRYSYFSFFFLFFILARFLKTSHYLPKSLTSLIYPAKPWRSRILSFLIFLLLSLQIFSITNFAAYHWQPIVNRDHQFASDLVTLFRKNSEVPNLPVTGIESSLRLSDFWYLSPNKKVTFLPESSFSTVLNPSDPVSRQIYSHLRTSYQKKLD